MKVIGFRTTHDPAAPPGQRIVHVAELACGHWRRVAHGHVPTALPCDEGCDHTCRTCGQLVGRCHCVGGPFTEGPR